MFVWQNILTPEEIEPKLSDFFQTWFADADAMY